jgi:hypothetical protein
VQALTVAEALVNRGVEPVKDAELELVRALEEVFKIAERKYDVCDPRFGLRCDSFTGRIVG